VAEGDPAFGEIVRGNLDLHPVTGGDPNEMLPHFAADVRKNFVSVLQLHFVHGCGKDLVDDTVNLKEILIFFSRHNERGIKAKSSHNGFLLG
jgi:hypothetical protein